MKFTERWRLSGTILAEARFTGYLDSNPMYRTSLKENPDKIIQSIKSNVKINNIFLIILLIGMAISSFAAGMQAHPGVEPTFGISISFATYLGLMYATLFFLNLLATTGFFNAELYTLPAIQPLSRRESTELFMLAFVRIFFWPVIAAVATYPLLLFFSHGILAALIAVVACASTAILSIGSLILTSRWFYRKAHSSTQSKATTVLRFVAGLGLVLGMMAIYSMMSVIPRIIEFIFQATSSSSTLSNFMIVLSVMFPFSYGQLLAVVINPSALDPLMIIMTLLGSALYTGLAYVAYRRGGGILESATIGGLVAETTSKRKQIGIRIRRRLFAIIFKDVRIASRSLGSTIIFVLPILMILVFVPASQIWVGSYLRSSFVLMEIVYVQMLSGLIVLSLLAYDTQGSSIMEGLPLGSTDMVYAKTILFFTIQSSAFIVISVLIAFSNPITPLLMLLPLFQIPVSFAMCAITIVGVYRLRGNGRSVAVSMTGDAPIVVFTVILAGLIGSIPLLVYVVLLLQYHVHLIALLGQVGIGVLLVLLAVKATPHLLKD
ncbi:MAG: hypothetical protein K9W43_11575 [Candidatus Thorarchaeota archaeon]|nr:hypothetical protein [Candidatus Thorarchaeota archaeon]